MHTIMGIKLGYQDKIYQTFNFNQRSPLAIARATALAAGPAGPHSEDSTARGVEPARGQGTD